MIFAAAAALAADPAYIAQLPTGDDWLRHLNKDLLPFWTMPSALGNPAGAFPSTRCDDGSPLDFENPCTPIAGNAYLMTQARYLVPLSRQTYGYGVAYHLTGDLKYLDWMKAGVAYIRKNAIDPAGGMFTQMDLTTGAWGPAREIRDPQQLGYGLLGLVFYYYLTRDDDVLPDILAIKKYINGSYYNASLGTNQWLLRSDGSTRFDQKALVADLDQMNTYLVLLAPILPEPYHSQWTQTMTTLSRSMLGTFYSPEDNLFFLAANTPHDRNLAFTGVDYGHTSKALWMLRWTGLLTGDQGLFSFASAAGRRHLDRAYLPEDGSWAGGVRAGAATDKNKNWWVFAELDQLSGTLALADLEAGHYLPQTNQYWFQYFVDHAYGEVWNGVNYGTNTPQRDYPKSWQWKSAYHDFEHTLVGYITAQQLHNQPFTLYYAFTKEVDPATIHPYYFSGSISSIMGKSPETGAGQWAVTFRGDPPAAVQPLAVTSAASFLAGPVAAGSIATIWGPSLGAATGVTVKDAAGTVRQAQPLDVSPGQTSFQVPAGTGSGPATVTVALADGTSIGSTAQIVDVEPGIFMLNASTALAAANVVRVMPDQSQTIESVTQPINLGAADLVYLVLFATGVRNARSVVVTVGAQPVPVLYSGAQGLFAGLDQVNIGPLPRALAGSGKVTLVLAADGQTSNPVELMIQ